MTQAIRDENRVPTLIGVDSIGFSIPTLVAVNTATHALLIEGSLSVSGLPTAIVDGEAVNALNTGNLALGTDGSNYQVLAVNSSGHLLVDIQDTSITVDSEFPAAVAITDDFANPTTTSVMGMTMVWDGSKWDRAIGDSTNGLTVNLGSNNDVTVTGTVTANLGTTDNGVLDDISTSVQLTDDTVYVDDADWTDSTSKHLLVGGVYQSTPQTITDGDVGPLELTSTGSLRVAATIASGDIASGAIASGAIASGAVASGAVASGAFASGSISDGAIVTLGAKADAKNTATDTTSITAMQVLKEISYMEQNPASRAVTGSVTANAGTNLNTSLLALESGGNLASLVTSSQLIDDVIYTSGDALGKVAGIAAQFDDVSPGTVTENKMAPLRMSTLRGLYTTIRDAAGNERGLNVDANGAIAITVTSIPSHAVTNAGTFAVQVDGSALTALQLIDNAVSGAGFNITQVNGETIDVGAGTEAAAIRVTLPTDGTGYVKLGTGTNSIGKLGTANSGVDIGDVDVTSISAGTNLVGDVDIQPRTTGGWSVANFTSGDTYTALTNSAQVIKASAGKFGGYYIFNPNAAATYVMIYNIAAASVTVGTSTALLVFCIPASSAANLEILAGIPFSNAGWSIATATTGGGNTAPTTALEAMVWYK